LNEDFDSPVDKILVTTSMAFCLSSLAAFIFRCFYLNISLMTSSFDAAPSTRLKVQLTGPNRVSRPSLQRCAYYDPTCNMSDAEADYSIHLGLSEVWGVSVMPGDDFEAQ
jgi:hypothetical protein